MTVTEITKPGIYRDFPSDAYFADPAPIPSLTQSIAKLIIEQSPAHAFAEHPRLSPREDEDEEDKYVAAQAIGNATHAMLIGRGKTIACAAFPDWRTKEAKAFRAEQTKLGNTPILAKHLDEAATITAETLRQVANAGWIDAFKNGDGEVVLAWEENGIWLRTMIDWLTPDLLTAYDLKTGAVSFAPHDVARKMVADGWDVQAAMHERALNALDPANAGRRKFRFIGVENYAPYAMVPVEITEAVLTMGRKKLEYAIGRWRECMKTKRWPGYGSEVVRPEYPGYAETSWLARETEYEARRPAPLNVLMAG